MTFVLDTSTTMAWCLEDEATVETEAVFDRLKVEGVVVPSIWPLEVANALIVSERRQRLTEPDTESFIDLLETLPITVDDNDGRVTVRDTVLANARRQQLSAYDASYLDLAIRRKLPLATRDRRLRSAATRAGVLLLDGTVAED